MPTESQGSTRTDAKRVPERTLADVAREAFENRVVEGDHPVRRPRKHRDQSSA